MGQDKDGSHLDSTILLLSHTTKLVDLFNDKLAIKSNSDPRLIGLDQFYKFMSNWRNETLESNDQFVLSKLWFDLQSMCLGFGSMVAVKQAQFPSSVITPALVNQDGVENHFCQVRSCNGQSKNQHRTRYAMAKLQSAQKVMWEKLFFCLLNANWQEVTEPIA